MRLIERQELFILLIFFGFLVLFLSIWGIVFNKDWNMQILISYILLLLFSVIIIVLKSSQYFPLKYVPFHHALCSIY